MSEEEIAAFAREHAEELAAPIIRLVGKVIAKGIQGHLQHAAELQVRVNALEATLKAAGLPLYELQPKATP